MKNDEARMPHRAIKRAKIGREQFRSAPSWLASSDGEFERRTLSDFVIRASLVIRHSTFIVRTRIVRRRFKPRPAIWAALSQKPSLWRYFLEQFLNHVRHGN